ncbi:unnamed protein product [Cylicocyclus nassatus]|uniref:Uncharacterized protein n=1 Tax=Cylicocyclus nassatus TaxID=53992 RepID=A0AA36HA78_CYLNA|nr:unnamed protein product [Cylicocyclus nassatus]
MDGWGSAPFVVWTCVRNLKVHTVSGTFHPVGERVQSASTERCTLRVVTNSLSHPLHHHHQHQREEREMGVLSSTDTYIHTRTDRNWGKRSM